MVGNHPVYILCVVIILVSYIYHYNAALADNNVTFTAAVAACNRNQITKPRARLRHDSSKPVANIPINTRYYIYSMAVRFKFTLTLSKYVCLVY